MSEPVPQFWSGIERVRQYADARRMSAERCEFCGADIAPEHAHLVNVASRTLLCVCRPCYLLFAHDGAGGARFRAVPTRYQRLAVSEPAAGLCDALRIPIGLVFFFESSVTGQVTAFYPSPAGATEAAVSCDAWANLVHATPALGTLAPDVEALLVRRRLAAPGRSVEDDTMRALIVPIDACYELVGRIRRGWRGFHGGDEVWTHVDAFFTRVDALARDGASS